MSARAVPDPPRPPDPRRAIRHVAVFCGSRLGARPAYADAVASLGRGLASRGIGLIYGGGRVGLMGVLADAVLDNGGTVAGVIPRFLSAREIAHPAVVDLTVTDSMHSRKAAMFARADAFITMPGGLGTLDELVEIVTWRQLGLHDKPILVVDVGGWGRAILDAFADAIASGFADPSTRRLFDVAPDTAAALAWLADARPGGAADDAGALA